METPATHPPATVASSRDLGLDAELWPRTPKSQVAGPGVAAILETADHAAASPEIEATEGESETAFEIQNQLTSTIYAAGGDNPMPREVWDQLETDLPGPYVKNTTRNLLFQESEFLQSPSAEESGELVFIDYLGFTWLELAQTQAAGLYLGNEQGTALESGFPTINPGEVLVSIIDKPQLITYTDGPVQILTDEWGNRYVMHATNAETDAEFEEAVSTVALPPGWSVAAQELTEPLALAPSFSGPDGFYVIIRDNNDNAYHQFSFAGGTQPTQFTGEGAFIVGGNDSDTLTGTEDANRLNAAQGDDTVFGLAGDDELTGADGDDSLDGGEGDDSLLGGSGNDQLTGGPGNDRLDGGEGVNTAIYGSERDAYSIAQDDSMTRIAGPDGDDTLVDIQFLSFSDGLVPLDTLSHGPGTTSVTLGPEDNHVLIGGSLDFTDFGGADTYTLMHSLLHDVTITDKDGATINLPEQLTLTGVSFLSNGVQFHIDGNTVTVLGAPQDFTYVFAGSAIDPEAGVPRTYAETAQTFGTTVPDPGAGANIGHGGTVQPDGSVTTEAQVFGLSGRSPLVADRDGAQLFEIAPYSNEDAVPGSSNAALTLLGSDPDQDRLRFDDTNDPSASHFESVPFPVIADDGSTDQSTVSSLDDDPGHQAPIGSVSLTGVLDASAAGESDPYVLAA